MNEAIGTATISVEPDTRRLRIMAEEMLATCDRIEARVTALDFEDLTDVLRDGDGNEISVPDGGDPRTAQAQRVLGTLESEVESLLETMALTQQSGSMAIHERHLKNIVASLHALDPDRRA